MKLLVDMNLSPRWVGVLVTSGIEATHWSTLGANNAPDSEIMAYARANDYVVLTHDLDYWPLGKFQLFSFSAFQSFGVSAIQRFGVQNPEPQAQAGKFSTFNFQLSTFLRLLLDKLPFLLLSIASSVVTVCAQRAGGSVMDLTRMDFWARLDNALVSYVRYLAKTIWPQHLAAYYPIQVDWAGWQVLGSAALLAAISGLAWGQWRRRP